MTADEFIDCIEDKNVALVGSEIMKCDSWLNRDVILRVAIKPDIFHYYHYKRQECRLVHIKYCVE